MSYYIKRRHTIGPRTEVHFLTQLDTWSPTFRDRALYRSEGAARYDANKECLAVGDSSYSYWVMEEGTGLVSMTVSVPGKTPLSVEPPTPYKVSTPASFLPYINAPPCMKCNSLNPHAEPNRPGGKYLCFECRT